MRRWEETSFGICQLCIVRAREKVCNNRIRDLNCCLGRDSFSSMSLYSQTTQAVLTNPGSNDKHACWWTKVYGTGFKKLEIVYRAGSDNLHSSRCLVPQPHLPAPVEGVTQGDVQDVLSTVHHDSLLQANLGQRTDRGNFAEGQRKDDHIRVLVDYLDKDVLPKHTESACRVVLQVPSFTNMTRHEKKGLMCTKYTCSHLSTYIFLLYATQDL